MRDRLLPRHLAPGVADLGADHRLEDALAVIGVAPGEAALDAGMAAVRLAVLVRHHAHDLVAAHLGLERAADAAIGAGRDHRMLGRADVDDGFFVQRRGRASLHAGAARYAFRAEERFLHARRNHRAEAAAGDRQREGALHFLAGAHAARADDAFRRIVGEIGVRTRRGPDSDAWRRCSRNARRAGRPRQPCPEARNRRWPSRSGSRADDRRCKAPSRPCAAASAGRSACAPPCRSRPASCTTPACRRGRRSRRGKAGRSRTLPACRSRRVSESWSQLHRGAHDRRALGHRDRAAVDGQRDRLLRLGAGCAVVDLLDERHGGLLYSAACRRGRAPKSSGKWLSALITG